MMHPGERQLGWKSENSRVRLRGLVDFLLALSVADCVFVSSCGP